ncbi:MAG: hypothetical protein ACI4Q9_05750, partial [Candidatus Methanomethylophilaceae archaeon]
MNRKSGKLVAPAVALMLCAVALIGVGFAITLQSTSTAEDNTASVSGLILDLTGDGSDNAVITESAAVYYETVQNAANGTITYKLVMNQIMDIAAGKVKVTAPGSNDV